MFIFTQQTMYDPNLFGEKYYIRSNRLAHYDYSSEGRYFVTICTKNMEHFFGKVENGLMMLNKMGKIVEDEIKNIPKNRKNVRMDLFVVMPNHVHMVLKLCGHGNAGIVGNAGRDVLSKRLYDGTRKKTTNTKYTNISPKANTLGNIIKLFKGYTTKRIGCAIWQSNYYDHIVMDDRALRNIQQYIVNNPVKWHRDRNNVT